MSDRYRKIDLAGFDGFRHSSQDAPELKWVDISDLVIDDTYQRKLEKRGRKNIEAIAADFWWSRFTPLLVAPVIGGRFAIIDGQHRTHAAAIFGYKSVPAMVVEMPLEEQARAFSWVNGNVTNVTPFQIFRAALAAGEDWAVRANAAVRAAGCRLMTANASTVAKKGGEVYCIGLVRGHVEDGNAWAVTAALHSLRQCADADWPVIYSATVLRPWITCLLEHGNPGEQMLVEFLDANCLDRLLSGVDKMRDTPKYFNKSRQFLLSRTMLALFKAFLREKAGAA